MKASMSLCYTVGLYTSAVEVLNLFFDLWPCLGYRSFSVAGPCLWTLCLSHYVTEISHLYSLRYF